MIYREPAEELEQHTYQKKYELRYYICFTKVRTRLSPTLRWGGCGRPSEGQPRGYHEGHSSQSLFQLLFLLPLVDSKAAESTVINFLWGTPQSLRCSPAMPNSLGPKSPRVTNANHEIDNMHKCSSGWIALFLNFTQPTIWFGKFDQSLTKRGLGELARLKNVYVYQQNQQPPKVEVWGYL